jgi:ataxin-10
MGEAQPDIWADLRRLWKLTATAHSGLVSAGEGDGEEDILQALCVSVARFTRNLVAAVPYNQQKALSALVLQSTRAIAC